MEKVTQETIAEQLHLSRNTVSKVFNGIPGVKEKTRERILERARLLGYTQPLLGNAGGPPDENTPVSKSTESRPTAELRYDIAFVCYQKSISDFFWMPIILNLERTLSQHGCTMRFVVIGLEHEQTMSPPGALLNNPPDGIVMAGLFQSEYYKSISSLGIPLVTFDISSDLFHCNRMCDVIMVENLGASYQLTRHLIEAGHTRIAFAGNKDSCQSFFERWQGYHLAMQESPLTRAGEITLHFNLEGADFRGKEYYTTDEFYEQLKSMPKLPTAFVCGNDYIASNVIKLKEPPYRLYDQVAVTGFDNTSELIASIPSCSTVDIHSTEIGQMMGEQILWRLQNPKSSWRCLRLDSAVIIK